MFWNNVYSGFTNSAKLRQENNALSIANAELQSKVDALNLQMEEINAATLKAASLTSMVVDFSNIDAFSIERNVSDDVPHTVIGYWLADGTGVKSLHEWYLGCSEETHERLVSEFKEYVKAKKQ